MVAARLLRGFLAGALALVAGCAAWEQERSLGPAAPPDVSVSNSPVEWKSSVPAASAEIVQVGQKEPPKKLPVREPFQLPSGLPGADAQPIKLPPLKDLTPAEREKKVREAFPALTALEEEPRPALPESGRPLSLSDLQEMALTRSPLVSRAAAQVDVAQGIAVQAGLCPNPHVGYQADQIEWGNNGNAGQQGAFIQQLFKTAGKLSLAQAVAGMDVVNAQVALRRARIDVATHVRSAYFGVLMAQETMRVSRALVELADEVYTLQLRLVATGEFFTHEPLQLHAQAVQARNYYAQARNRYFAAWGQLAAALGTLELPPQALAGRVDIAVPRYGEVQARAMVLAQHTDIATAQNSILQAQHQLRLAQVTPIPDVSASAALQHDNSTGNNQLSLQIGIALPVFDRNQGNIRAARAALARTQEELRVHQNDLSARLAEALGRYHTGQTLAANYRERILPSQSQAYRSIYQRYQNEPKAVGFNEVVVAQQNLSQSLSAYLTALGDQWTAVVDVAALLQIDDLYQPLDRDAK
jgi:cobalt-zinc-cadmium efflux system outer membrane protein